MGAAKDVNVMLGEPRKAILGMVVPVFIALLISQINIFVDSFWCSSLGVNALSTISLVSSLYYLLVGIGNGIGIGANVAISRRIGAKDRDGAEGCVGQAMVMMALISIPFIPLLMLLMDPIIGLLGGQDIRSECVEYLTPMFLLCTFSMLNGVISGTLRGEGAARLSTLINVVSAFVNMVLDPILIFVCGMGMGGASLATMVSAIVAVVLGLLAYCSRKTFLGIRFGGFQKKAMSDILYVGIPQAAEQCVMALMNLLLVYFVVICGGTDGLAVYGAPWRLVALAMVPANALAAAMVPVCSSAIGQRDPERLRTAYLFTVKGTLLMGSVFLVVLFLFADPAMYAFSYSDNMSGYHDDMVHAMRIFVWMLPCYGFIFVGSSMLSALRRSGYALISSFLRNLMLVLIYAVVCTQTMDWIYWGLTLGEIVGGTAMILLAHWQFRERYRSMVPDTAAA